MADAWTAFYWGDYGRKTSHLSLAEHGAYLLLMKHYYSTRKPLPTNVNRLYSLCRAVEATEQAAVDYVIGEFFNLTDEGYVQPRIQEELDKARKISEIRRFAVSQRTDRKAYKSTYKELTNDLQMNTQPQSQAQKKEQKPVATLPDWLPIDSWNAFLEMRKKQHKPATERAQNMLCKKLHQMLDEGANIAAILDQSTMNCWQDVFPLREERKPNGKQSLIDSIKNPINPFA